MIENYEKERYQLQKTSQDEIKKIKQKHSLPQDFQFPRDSKGDSKEISCARGECQKIEENYNKNVKNLVSKYQKNYDDQIANYSKLKENKNMVTDEQFAELKAENAQIRQKLKDQDKEKYDSNWKELSGKVDKACNDIDGCRKDIKDLNTKFDQGITSSTSKTQELFDKRIGKCDGGKCVDKHLEEITKSLDAHMETDKMLERAECPFCHHQSLLTYPTPSKFCQDCGKEVEVEAE